MDVFDNAVGLDGHQQRCARKPEVQSKVDVLSSPPAMAAEAAVHSQHRLNLVGFHETDQENGYLYRLPVFSYERSPSSKVHEIFSR